jgi:hypothetical protein
MGWSGGSYTKGNAGTGGWAGDASSGIGIEAGRHDTQDNDFATGINQCINKDGSNSATANLNLGGFRFTNAGTATGRTDLAQLAQVQDGDYIWLGTTGGTATAMTATAAPAIPAYKNGQKFRMKPGFDSTGASPTAHTLNVNSLGTKSIVEQDGQNPTLGSWFTGTNRTLELVYNDGVFVITSAPQYFATYTPTLTPQNGTATSVSFSIAKYQKIGSSVSIQIVVTWTQNTATASYIDITLPVRPSVINQGFNCTLTTASSLVSGFAIVASTVGAGTVRCYDYAQAAIATGSKTLVLSGTYEIG